MSLHILVVLAHPDPRSFNHALARTVCAVLRNNRHQVIFHDLCAEGFDPCLETEEIRKDGAVPAEVRRHCDELQLADGIVMVHPNWWGQPPAILKGWIDRVFRPGVAYRFEENDCGEGVPVGMLKARSALILNTSNTPVVRERMVFGDPLEAIWRKCIFELCGVTHIHRRMFNVICTSTPLQRKAWLDEAAGWTADLFPPQLSA